MLRQNKNSIHEFSFLRKVSKQIVSNIRNYSFRKGLACGNGILLFRKSLKRTTDGRR